MPKSYSEQDFSNDLQKLKSLISSNNKNKSNSSKNRSLNNQSNNNNNNNNQSSQKRSLNKQSNNNDYNQSSLFSQYGGKKEGPLRHFKIVMLDKKPVDIGSAEITERQTPLNAAKKLLRSIAVHRNMKGNAKLSLNAIFVIRETTQGSKKKEYGPYSGKYRKYSPEEMKAAETAGGKVQFKMTPVVRLYKSRNEKEFYNEALKRKIVNKRKMTMNKEKMMMKNLNMMKGGF